MADDIKMETMSDDDFINASESDTFKENAVEDSVEEPNEDSEDTEANNDSPGDTQDDSQSDVDDENDSEDDELEDTGDEDIGDDEQAELDTDTQDAENDTDEANEESDTVDYKTKYGEMLAPFMANGKEMKVDNVDDARKLMQMGAGFHKKMAELKPHLKIIKALKHNGLLDTDKVNYLIDLGKKKPDAIAKLLKESNIDPLDIDVDKAEDYKPGDYEISDSEFNLDQAIDGIKGNDSYKKSIAIMGEQWDSNSRKIISENPGIVSIIDEHVQNGVFDTVQGIVDKERTLGRMQDIPDVEAYHAVAMKLKESGALIGDKGPDNKPDNPKPKPDKKEKKRNSKRKAAGPTKGKQISGKTKVEDYSGLSDEEFIAKFGEGLQAV